MTTIAAERPSSTALPDKRSETNTENQDDDLDIFSPSPTTPSLSRRHSISSTSPSVSPSVALSSFTGIPESIFNDNDTASSLAPFFDNNPAPSPLAQQRRRSSLLRNALSSLRRPSNSNSGAGAALFSAVVTGNINALTSYHASGGPLDLLTAQNFNALHLAANANLSDIIEFLLSQPPMKPLINARSKRQNRSPLDIAAVSGAIECTRLLIEAGADISGRSNMDGATALHAASRGGNAEVIALLLDAGAAINEPSTEGFQPLHWATQGLGNRADTVSLLLSRGAYVNARTDKGFTSLQRAVMDGDIDVVRALLAHHLRDPAGSDYTDQPLQPASTCQCINSDGPFSMQPIHSAVFGNRSDILALLVTAGAEIEVRTHKGWTPLHVAARFGYQECRRVLVQAGANESAVTLKGWTPAEVARRWHMPW